MSTNESGSINMTCNEEEAPCIIGCPIRQDGRDYIQLIARRKFEEAFEVVKERNILPSACGRICTHPCEDKCRRSKLDSSIAIAWLKRFLSDRITLAPEEKPEVKFAEKIAIIGGGPAGLAAAHDLALLGYSSTIFEEQGQAGGMIGIGVPTFRLPRKEIQKDTECVRNLGVEIRCNTRVGTDITINDIKNEGFSAVFITAGLPQSKNLPIKGVEMEGVIKGVDFLHEANTTGQVVLGGKVLVIGGGAVAMDCARTALRLGPKEVHISCLESREEMPTSDYEIEETLHEGIILHTSWGPKRIVGENGKVTGLETLDVKAVFDDQGRFNPSFHEGSEKILEVDTVILAIGQGSDLSVIDGVEDIQTTRGGTIVVDKDSLMTDVPGIFAGGDIVLGRGTMTMSLEHGKRAALTIHNYLQNENKCDNRFLDIEPIPELAPRRIELIKREERAGMNAIDDNLRKSSFNEVETGYDEETAVKEAQRCMNCGAGAKVSPDICIGCLTCVRVCPYEIPVINNEKVAYIDGDCQSCGICVVECPVNAIEFKGSYEDQGKDELTNAIKGINRSGDPVIVNLFCHYNKFAGSMANYTEAGREVINVGVLGLSKIEPVLLLQAFENGADGIMVNVCVEEDCHYGSSCSEWAHRKITTAKQLLSSIGMDEEKVMVTSSSGTNSNLADATKTLLERIGTTSN